jgi:mRNA interferase RelE/StbE
VKQFLEAKRLEEIPSINKLKGFANAYRVRSGQYRIGLIREADGTILIAAIDTRKDFYRSFP